MTIDRPTCFRLINRWKGYLCIPPHYDVELIILATTDEEPDESVRGSPASISVHDGLDCAVMTIISSLVDDLHELEGLIAHELAHVRTARIASLLPHVVPAEFADALEHDIVTGWVRSLWLVVYGREPPRSRAET